MTRLPLRRCLPILLIAAMPALVVADQARQGAGPSNGPDLSAAKPGRAPDQPIDEAYTAKIREYTTEEFFLSPLVDYLPASDTVPTPAAVLGDIAGAPGKLPYTAEVHDYMRRLADASPRVQVFSIGESEEGREMIAVAVASEALMARLDENHADLAQLADPRLLGMSDAAADAIARRAAPVYYITGTIHSGEAGAPTALMELAYRLAVDESDYIRHIRNNLITLITPVTEVDGRDRMVDLYEYEKKYPDRTKPNLVYWGKYIAHDNNRDAMGATLELTRNVLNTFVGWKAQVLHDLHESVPYLYDNTIGDGPYNAWIDPLLANEWQMIGWNNVQEMTRFGMPGVFAFGNFDTWSPGYLMFIAAMHNGISRLYETFGNGGTAETRERELSPNDTSRTWYRQNPPLPRVMWSLRNNNNYEQTGLLVSLHYFATNRLLFLRNFYDKSKRSILKATTEGPAAYVLPADERRPGLQAELLNVLRTQQVELSRATEAFSLEVPAPREPGGRGGRGDRGGRGGGGDAPGEGRGEAPERARTETREFPAGSYVIRMDQPYSRIADALLDYQYWAPSDPQSRPYDDTGWTFPEGFNVEAVRVMDTQALEVPVTLVSDTVVPTGGFRVTGTNEAAYITDAPGPAAMVAINHNADNALVTLRYRLAGADIQVAEEPFEANGVSFNRGTFLIRGAADDALAVAVRDLGLLAHPLSMAPDVATHPARAARIAIMHTWQRTQTEGWWRLAFDRLGVPYDYISVQDVAADSNLRSTYDVIIFAPGGGSGRSVIDGLPMFRDPIPWKRSADTPNIGVIDETDDMRQGLGWHGLMHLQEFVRQGGVFLAAESSAEFAIEFGLTHGVSASGAGSGSRVVGSLLRTTMVDDASPIVYGFRDGLAVYSSSGDSFGVSASAGGGGRGGGGGGGGRGGGAGPRATGRGTPDDVDSVQGRPALDPRFERTERERVDPWAYAIPTEQQMRNPLNILPPEYRPRVPLRFADSGDLFVSGLLQGGGAIAQRPVVVDVPVGEGHVVLFANNPVWRGSTTGSYFLVFNTILNFDSLNAGRVLDPR